MRTEAQQPMTRPRLHLHIGLNKTGTTYLQAFLQENQVELQAHGFELAPLDNGKGAHHALYRLLESEGPRRFRDVLKTRSSAPDVILSCETLCAYLMDPDRAVALSESLKQDFDLRLYIWLRRQDRWVESLTVEAAKRRARGDHHRHDPALFDFQNRVETLVSAFGEDHVFIRIYRDDLKTDIFDEFLSLVGAPTAGMRRAQPQNVSPSRRQTLFLAGLPKMEGSTARFVMDTLISTKSIHDDGQRFLLSPEERRAALEPHIEGNHRIAERYDPTATEWFASLPPEEPDWFPPGPITVSEWFAIWRHCMLRCPNGKGRAFGLGAAIRVSRLMLASAIAGKPSGSGAPHAR